MAQMIGGITNMAMGTVGTIFSAIAGMKWDKQMSKLLEQDPEYKFDPYVKQRYGMAQTLLNARMPGAQSRERNIYSSGANAMAGMERGATDANQLLAAASGSQGQMGEQFNDLAQDEAQDYYNRLGLYNEASKGMTDETRNVFDDSLRRWQDKINIKTAQYKARAGGGQSIANLGGAFGNTSGFGGMGGGSSTGGGGGMSGGGSGGTMSDKRLKHNYHIVGKSPSGLNIYEFSYIGHSERYQGVMADEVGDAAFMTNSGYYAVDYSKIDVQFKQVN